MLEEAGKEYAEVINGILRERYKKASHITDFLEQEKTLKRTFTNILSQIDKRDFRIPNFRTHLQNTEGMSEVDSLLFLQMIAYACRQLGLHS